jgi:hypothetical protein
MNLMPESDLDQFLKVPQRKLLHCMEYRLPIATLTQRIQGLAKTNSINFNGYELTQLSVLSDTEPGRSWSHPTPGIAAG